MPTTLSPHHRLHELLSFACDGLLSEPEKLELANLLKGSDEHLIAEYFDFLTIDALLRDPSTHRRVAEHDDGVVPMPPGVIERPAADRHSTGRSRPAARPDQSRLDLSPTRAMSHRTRGFSRYRGMLAWFAAIAAGLTLMLSWQAFSDGPHATIIGIEQAAWVSPEAPDVGATLSGEWLELESGVVHLQFADGVHASLHGPSRLRTGGGSQCLLQWGELAAYVPPDAAGFMVETPRYRVTDLGTSFRMVVATPGQNERRSMLRVTEGRVEVAQLSTDQRVTLGAGQVASLERDHPLVVNRVAVPELRVEGKVELVATHPRSLGYREYTDDHRLAVFLERQQVELLDDVPLDAAATGRHSVSEPTASIATRGAIVDVYLVHYAPTSRRGQTRGLVRFPAPIVGVLYTSKRLNETNSTLGAGCTLRCRHPERGLEMSPNRNSDVFTISSDRRTLTVRCRAESIDQLRVLVESAAAL